MTGLRTRFTRWTLASPRSVWVVVAALTLLAAGLLPSLKFEPDVSKLLPQDSPTIGLARQLEQATGLSRTLIIDIRAQNLEALLPAIVESLRASPCLESVQATKEEFLGEAAEIYRNSPLYYLPEQTLDDLRQRIVDERDEALQSALEELATDPIAAGETVRRDPLGLRWILKDGAESQLPVHLAADSPYLMLESGERAIIRAKGAQVPYDIDFSNTLLADIEQRMQAFDVEWGLFGDYVQAQHDSQRIQHDLRASILTSLVLIGSFLLLTMRRWVDPALVFVPVVVGIFWALPLGGALLGPLNGLTISAAAILAGLGVDFTIHYLVRYAAERRRHGHLGAVYRTLRGIGRPLFASALTTMAAFLSLTSADFSGMRVFGVLLALGLGLVFLAAFLLLPLALGFVRGFEGRASSQSSLVSAFDRVAHSRAAPAACLLTLAVVALGFVLVGTKKVSFATDLHYLRPPEDRGIAIRQEFEDELGFGLMPAAIFLPENMDAERLHQGLRQLESSGDFGLCVGPHQLLPSAEQSARVQSFRIAVRGWVDSTVAELEELGFNSDAFLEGLHDFDDAFQSDPPAELPTISVPWQGEQRQLLLLHPCRMIEDLPSWHRLRSDIELALGPDILSFQAYDLIEEIHRLLFDDLVRAALLTAGISILLASWLSGGLRYGLLAMVPAVCGFGVTLGALAWTETPLNMGNCVCIPFLLGIGVDHGIHLVAHFKQTGSTTLGTCGIAIWRSSATTVLGFGSLVVADTPAIASMGVITTLGVVASATTSFLVLPVLWRLCTPHPEPKAPQ